MKKRLKIKKYNREVKEFNLNLKRDKTYSHDKLFMSYEYYDDSDFTWSDVYFIGTFEGRKRVFNCTIQSSLDKFNNVLDDLIMDKLEEYFPNYLDNKKYDFVETEDPKLKSLEVTIFDKNLDEQIENKRKDLRSELAKDIKIKSYIKILLDYQYGVGVDVITEEKYLNKQIIIDYIKRIQSMNITSLDKIYFSNNEIVFTEEEHYEYIDRSRPLNVKD